MADFRDRISYLSMNMHSIEKKGIYWKGNPNMAQ